MNRRAAPRTRIVIRDLSEPASKFVRLFERDAATGFVDNRGTRFYFSTDKDAPHGKIVALDLHDPAHRSGVVPEGPDAMQSADAIGGKLFLSYLHDVHTQIKAYDFEGRFAGDVALPGVGTARISGWPDRDEAFVSYTDYTTPPEIFRYDAAGGERSLVFAPHVPFDPSRFGSEQVFVTSKDGTRVPMFVLFKKGRQAAVPAPAILTGYGGFDIPLEPGFSSFNIP